MKILLISMPDTADFIDNAIRLPNLSLVSLAGNLPGHEVTVLDLVLYKPHVKKILKDTLNSFQPEIVGMSAMTFQFETLLRVASFIREINPSIKIVAGGYHATLMAEEETSSGGSHGIDFFVRNDHFGSLKVGPRIELFNTKMIFVHAEQYDCARELISDFLETIQREKINFQGKYSTIDKVRMLIETILFAWIMPGRVKKRRT